MLFVINKRYLFFNQTTFVKIFMQCSSISLEKSTELSLTDLPKDTLANLGFNLDVVHPKYFKDCKVGSVAQTCLPAFLDKHFGERVRDLTSQDV